MTFCIEIRVHPIEMRVHPIELGTRECLMRLLQNGWLLTCNDGPKLHHAHGILKQHIQYAVQPPLHAHKVHLRGALDQARMIVVAEW